MDRSDYNKGGMTAFVFAMSFNAVFFIYICFFHPGVNLSHKPADQAAVKVEEPKKEEPKKEGAKNEGIKTETSSILKNQADQATE